MIVRPLLTIIYGFIPCMLLILAPSCPKSPDSYIEAGRKCYEKKDYKRSYKFYTRAIKLNPTLYQAYWERANVEIAMDSLERAIDDITMYIESNPERLYLAKAYNQRAEVMYKLGYKSDACLDWDSACQLNVNNAPCEQYRLKCK